MLTLTRRALMPGRGSLLRRSISRLIHSGDDVEAVQRGMQRWVDELIVAENLCPFAAKSSYQFQIYPEREFTEDSISFFRYHVIETGANTEQKTRLNTFVVFPFMQEFWARAEGPSYLGVELFNNFFLAAVDECKGLALTTEMEVDNMHQDHPQKNQQVVAMPFHPDYPKSNMQTIESNPEAYSFRPSSMNTEERHYTTCSPFPAIHLIRKEDLQKARRDVEDFSVVPNDNPNSHFPGMTGPKVTIAIMDRNSSTLSRIGLSALQERMEDYKNELPPIPKKDFTVEVGDKTTTSTADSTLPFYPPSVIQVVEQPSPERLKQLEEQGIRVEVLKTAPTNAPQKLTIGKNKSKKKKKKGKKR